MHQLLDRRNIPLCMNCKHFLRGMTRCSNPLRRTWDPVFGMRTSQLSAFQAREHIDDCGPEGRWFEPTGKRVLTFKEPE